MRRLRPRHRRKAGFGPPAKALIAWIVTDPYLRQAAAAASYRRTIDRLPSHTRSATAAVAACFVLACGTVLGITAIINHGRTGAQYPIATPPLADHGIAAAPPPESVPITPAEVGPHPVISSGPAAVGPMLADPAASPPTAVPPAAQRTDQVADGDRDGPTRYVRSGAVVRPVPPVSAPCVDQASAADKAMNPTGEGNADKPSGADKSPDAGTPVEIHQPSRAGTASKLSQADHLDWQADPGNRGASGNPAYLVTRSSPLTRLLCRALAIRSRPVVAEHSADPAIQPASHRSPYTDQLPVGSLTRPIDRPVGRPPLD